MDGARVPYPLALRVSALLAMAGRWPGPLAADVEHVERATGAARHEADSGAHPVPSAPRGPAVIAMSEVAWAPPGARQAPVLEGIDLEVRRGEIVAVIGRSGTGKSTLLRLAAGLLTPTRGAIHREPPAVPRVRPVALALEYPERQLFGRTVLEDVQALLWVDGVPAEERERSARRAMSEVGLDPERFASRFPMTLSEGEKRRAALAGVLIEPPQLLLLDEPTAGLDPEGRRSLALVVAALRERERGVILASHDLAFVAAVADRVVVLARDEEPGGRAADGTVRAQGQTTGRMLVQGPAWAILREDALLDRARIPLPDFVRLERALRAGGLLAATPVRDEESLLLSLSRGAAVAGPA